MPNRNIEGNYRYKYQGQEKDPETGKEAFELRLWDSRIGRWLTTDPMGEFHSPYLGMGNNPISLIDPTGGMTDDPPTEAGSEVGQIHFDPDTRNTFEWDGSSWHSDMASGFNLGEASITGFGGVITAMDVTRTVADFTPGVGAIWDITEGVQNGNGWQVAAGVGFLVLDIATLGGSSLIKGTVKTGVKQGLKYTAKKTFQEATEQGAERLLITAGKKALHKHHVLPQQFRKWFADKGIKNIDDYTVKLSQKTHLRTVHGQGKWNKKWADFIDSNPNASPSEIFHQAEGMLKEQGLQHLPYIKY